MTNVVLRHSAWFGDKKLNLSLPENWEVLVHSLPNAQPMAQDHLFSKIAQNFRNIHVNLSAHTRIAIIVDDISRPTPVANTVSFLLKLLLAAKVPRKNILIITAGGTHDKMTQLELEKKLGSEIVSKYQVFPHDMKENLIFCGKTCRNTPVYVNRLVMQCHLKLVIGGVYHHSPAGFGGGAKIILGVCGFRTITYLHYNFKGSNIGGELDNEFRRELEEIAKIVRVDLAINIVINDRRELTQIFVGDIIESHKEAVDYAKKLYAAYTPANNNIIIANTYPFDTSLVFSRKGWWPTTISSPTSTNILVGAFPLGLGDHGIHPISTNALKYFLRKITLFARLPPKTTFNIIYAKLSNFRPKSSPDNKPFKQILCLRPNTFPPIPSTLGIQFYSSWSAILALLAERYNHMRPTVAIYPCASLQYPLVPYV